MKYLRSPSVHHLAPDPFALKKFAGKKPRSRRGKFSFPYDRPLLQFFNKHCESLIGEYSLEDCHYPAMIENIEVQSGLVRLKTAVETELITRKVVLALGQSEKLCISRVGRERLTSSHAYLFFLL